MSRTAEITTGYGAVAVALAAIVLYAGALANGFAFDDVVLIPNDARVINSQIGALLTRPYWNDHELGLFRPLTSLSFGLDWLIGNGRASWFHFTNVLAHALASVLAFLLLARFFRTGAALAGGLAFALHPVHVEAVANVVGRSEMFAASFVFAACLIWTSRSITGAARLWLTVLCYALAMFAKESAVVLPGLLILLDLARGEPVRGYARKRWREVGALALTLVVFMALRWIVIGGIAPARLDPVLEVTRSTSQRWMTALQAWPIYAELLFVPRTLLADYGPRVLMPVGEWTPRAVIGLTIVLASVIGGTAALVMRHGKAMLGLLWFPLTILPVSNVLFPIGVIVAERTLYLPLFALCIGAAAAWQAAPDRRLAWIVAGLIATGYTARTLTRVPDWHDTDTIMIALRNDRPDAFRAQWHLARYERNQNNVDAALKQYDTALRLWPYREGLVQEAAAFGSAHGRAAWARDVAFWGTQRWPENEDFHQLLAANAVDLGDTITARRAVRVGLQRHPDSKILNDMWRAFGPPRETQ